MIKSEDIQMIDLESLPLLNEINFENPKEVLQFIDDRGFNYLMIASEHGRSDLIEPLLKIGIDVNSKFGSYTAASLAYQNRHFDTLLELLKVNSKFPPNFNAYETQHFGLIEFSALMTRFHESIKTEEDGDIVKIIENNHRLQHFYNTKNMSAPFVAIANGMFEMYELLITNNIFISSTENFSDAIKELNEEQKLVLRQIHERHAIGFEENHLRVICGSIFVGHDVPTTERIERLMIAKKAFFFLNTIPMIRQILLLIASARCFKIIFDFNRDHIQFIDPTNDIGTKGAFYLSRHIYIAARSLLDGVEKFKAYGTIVHELCHFAMDLVYDNRCKPFESFDLQRKFQFFFISCDCHNLPRIEPIIDSVFTNYSADQQSAELIVRVPQIVVMYQNDPERLKILRAAFHKLFEYYETHVMYDIERTIPNINSELNLRCERFLETTKKKASKWRKISIFAMFTAIFVTFAAFLCFYQPTFVWSEMTQWQKEKVMNGNVKFVDIEVKFYELFDRNNSEVFKTLSSQQIQNLLSEKFLDLNENQNKHLEEKIHLIWSNSSAKLRNKIKKGRINFQGQKLDINKIVENDTRIFESLTSNQIFQLLKNEKELKVGHELSFQKFYVERSFLKKKCDEIDLLQLNDCDAKNFEDLMKETEEKKLLLIADEAGEGKTTTLKHFTIKLKQNFPLKWISFIDLKNHVEIYKKSQNLEIIEILTEILKLSNENFELKIFEKLFLANQTIFLWDGFDEISPDYETHVLEIFTKIHKSTENQQFITSRPRYANEIENLLNIKRYMINSYTKEERETFLENLFAFRNQSYENYKTIIKEVIKSIEVGSEQMVTSPLLLHMIANIAVDLPINSNSYNLYSIYEEFINQKSSIFMSKGDVAKDDIQKSLNRNSKIDQVYQHFAIKTLFPSGTYRDFSSFGFNWPTNALDVMKENFSTFFDAVSRRGLLRIDTENDFTFDHRTFAEFFVARYLIEKVCNNDDPVIDSEIHRRLNFFFASLQIPKVCDFLLYYPDHCTIRGNFMKFLVFKYSQILKTLLSKSPYVEDQILTIGIMPKLLRRQIDLIRILWEIDANQTFANFYAIAYPADFVDNFEFLKRFSHGLLANEEDEKKFLSGKFQRGNFLLSSLELQLTIDEESDYLLDEYFEKYFEYLNIETNEFDLNKLRKCENFHQKFLYLKTFLSNEELLEIFMRKDWSVFEIYIPYEENLSQFWIDFEETFTPSQIQQIFLNPIADNLIILSYEFQSAHNNYFIEIAKKYEKYVNSTEKLRHKFLTKVNNDEFLSFIFNYDLINREILKSFFNLIKIKFPFKKRFSLLEAKVREVNGIESENMLFSALGYTTKESFNLILNFYNETFTKDRMRNFVLSYFKRLKHVDNFLYIYSHFLPHARIDAFEVFIDYVTELFSENTQELETVLTNFVVYIKFYEKNGDKYAQHFIKLFESLLINIRNN